MPLDPSQPSQPQTPISGLGLPDARKSLLLSLQQMIKDRQYLESLNVSILSDEEAKRIVDHILVSEINLEQLADHIVELEGA